jgi:hypothetical protein
MWAPTNLAGESNGVRVYVPSIGEHVQPIYSSSGGIHLVTTNSKSARLADTNCCWESVETSLSMGLFARLQRLLKQLK